MSLLDLDMQYTSLSGGRSIFDFGKNFDAGIAALADQHRQGAESVRQSLAEGATVLSNSLYEMQEKLSYAAEAARQQNEALMMGLFDLQYLSEEQVQVLRQLCQGQGVTHDSLDSIRRVVTALLSVLPVHFGETQQRLVELRESQDEIAEILRHPRLTEARDLLTQALKFMRVRDYERAYERLQRALEFDPTDFSILLNTARVECWRGEYDDAIGHLHDALALNGQPLSRPPLLAEGGGHSPDDSLGHYRELFDEVCGKEALGASSARHQYETAYDEMALAHKHLAMKLFPERRFIEAWENAVKAMGLGWPKVDLEPEGGGQYFCGVLAANAGKVREALWRINAAIKVNPAFLVRAAADTESDLGVIRDRVLQLVTDVALKAYRQAMTRVAEVGALAYRSEAEVVARSVGKGQKELRRIQDLVLEIDRRLRADTVTYSQCVGVLDPLDRLERNLRRLRSDDEDLFDSFLPGAFSTR